MARAWEDLAVVGAKLLDRHFLVRSLTLWLKLASHRKVKHVLILFQNAEVTFLRCLEHVCLFDVECFKTSDASDGPCQARNESFEMLALDASFCSVCSRLLAIKLTDVSIF